MADGSSGGAARRDAGSKPISELACHSTSYSNIVSATADYVARHVLNKEGVAQHDDLAFCVKAPLLLFEANRTQDAQAALHVAAQYVEQGFANSRAKVYGHDYPHCDWLWICWAATRMSEEDLADRCFKQICGFQHQLTHSGLVRKPFRGLFDFEADFFVTAICAKGALLRNDVARAEGAGDALTRAIDANRTNMSKRQRFNLRWRWHDGLVEEEGPTHCVLQASRGQLHSMLGFPALVLLELSQTELARASTYAIAAADLLHFIKGNRDLQNSSEAYVVAAAAAAANDSSLAMQVADKLASQLRESASVDAKAWDVIDDAAEAAVWLCHVNHSLAGCVSGEKKRKAKHTPTTQLPEDEGSLVAARKRKNDEEELEETKKHKQFGVADRKTLKKQSRSGEGHVPWMPKEAKELQNPEEKQEEKKQEEKKHKEEQSEMKKRKKRKVAAKGAEEPKQRKEPSMADRETLEKHKSSREGQAPCMPKDSKQLRKPEKKQNQKQKEEQAEKKKRKLAAKGAKEMDNADSELTMKRQKKRKRKNVDDE